MISATCLPTAGADLVADVADIRGAAKAAGLYPAKLALNCVGGPSAVEIAKLLGPGGVHVTYGGMSREPFTVPISLLIFKDLKVGRRCGCLCRL